MIDGEHFHELLTPIGQDALRLVSALKVTDATLLTVLQKMRREFAPELATAAVQMVLLRQKAAVKFSRAESMYFTREGLEQSTSETIAMYRALRFRDYPLVGDFGCGIGGDTIGLSHFTQVIAVDSDSVRLAMAEQNAIVYEHRDRCDFRSVDLLQFLPEVSAAFIDPGRRDGNKRHRDAELYHPPLSVVQSWRERIPAIGLKLSPAVPTTQIEELDGEIEFISLRGELKECVAWFGPLGTVKRRATLLPGPHTFVSDEHEPLVEMSETLEYLYDPDSAITRSGLLSHLAQEMGAFRIDHRERYLTSEHLISTPFATAIHVEHAMRHHGNDLRAWLREHDIGSVELRYDTAKIQPETLMKSLKLSGSERRVLVLATISGEPWGIVGRVIG